MTMPRKIRHGILLGVLATLAGAVLNATGLLYRLENVTWDWRAIALAKPSPATSSICLILVDQTSLDWAEETLKVMDVAEILEQSVVYHPYSPQEKPEQKAYKGVSNGGILQSSC